MTIDETFDDGLASGRAHVRPRRSLDKLARLAVAALWLSTGCGDDGGGSGADETGTTSSASTSTDGGPSDGTGTATSAATGSDGSTTATTGDAFAFTEGPIFTLGPVPEAPLAGLLEVSTNLPSTITVELTHDTDTWQIQYDESVTEHDLTVLGFYVDSTHAMSVTATSDDGQTITADLDDVVTDPLPAEGFPELNTEVSDPAQMEPGYTVFNLANYVIIVDELGEIRWYYHSEATEPIDIRRLDNGHLLVLYRDRLKINELDMLGNVVNEWHPSNSTDGNPGSIPVATDSFHHEVYPLDDGNFMTLSTEMRDYPNYPTSELDPTPQMGMQAVVGDIVVVFAPDGTIVSEYKLLDIMDPYRIQYDSFADYWDEFYGVVGAADWSHANAAILDSDGGIIVSARNQDTVLKFDTNGDLVWILGPHDNWGPAFDPYLLTPTGMPFEWNYHQHAPQLLPDGDIVLFDNGNYRVSPPTPKPMTNYSRAVEFAIDPGAMEVSQVWEYDAGQMLYAPAVGDADRLPMTDNTLIVYGVGSSRLREVTHDTGDVVFELSFVSMMFRAERLPTLMP